MLLDANTIATLDLAEAMRSASTVELGLTGRTLRSLRAFFEDRGHYPSEDHWSALRAIARTMETMVEGTCPAKVHLAPCDPGVGKSRTAIHFARELMADPTYADAALIISVYTIAEAAAMAEALVDVHAHLCVLTSDAAANALGGARANDAQILITTQQRLGTLTHDRPFSSVGAFFYRGRPRQCRVWDESVLPGSLVVIGADSLIGMASRLRGLSPELVQALYSFGSLLLKLEDGVLRDNLSEKIRQSG